MPLDLDPRSGLPPYLEPFLPYFKTRRTVPFMDQLWPNADTQQAHFAAAQDLLAGRETVDGALERLDRAYARPVRRGPGEPTLWFAAPALALYALVVLYPSLAGAAAAFTDWDGLGGGAQLRRPGQLPPPAARRTPPAARCATRCC